jgi:hypothetical protein
MENPTSSGPIGLALDEDLTVMALWREYMWEGQESRARSRARQSLITVLSQELTEYARRTSLIPFEDNNPNNLPTPNRYPLL